MRKNKNILKKGMILAAVSTMVVTMAPAIRLMLMVKRIQKQVKRNLMQQQQNQRIIRAG